MTEVQASREELRHTLAEYIEAMNGATVRAEREPGVIIVTLGNAPLFESILEAVQRGPNAE